MLIFSDNPKNCIRLDSDGVFTFGTMSCFWSTLTVAPSSRLTDLRLIHMKLATESKTKSVYENHHLLSMTSIYDCFG